MRLKYLVFPIYSIILLGSCQKSHVYEFSKDQTIYPKKEMINIEEIMSPSYMILKDNILVISSYQTDYSLFLFQTPSLEFIKPEGRLGNGPDEINPSAAFCRSSNDYLYVTGYTPYTIRKISFGQNGEFNFIKDIDIKTYDIYNSMSIINDSVLIYSPELMTIVKYDLPNEKEIDRISYPHEDRTPVMYDKNRGVLSSNDSYLIYAHCHSKEIDIYDVNTFKLIKKISDGKKYPQPDITVADDAIPLQRSVIAEDSYFYVLGRFEKNRNNHNTYIEVFDYDGNPITKYLFEEEISLFAIDHNNGYIYGYDYSTPDNLWRYDIKQ